MLCAIQVAMRAEVELRRPLENTFVLRESVCGYEHIVALLVVAGN